MHVSFVPIKDGKLSAKTLFSREALSDLQTTFFEQVGKQWGLQRGEKHTAKRKHLATPDFKRLTAEGLAQMSISPQDLEPKVLEKRLLKTTVETKGEVAKRLSKKYILPLVKELQKLLLEVKAQEALARSREGAFQEKKELEKGLNATQRTLLKTATKALSKKLKKDRETLERQYGEAICKLIKPESPSVATQYKEYDEYLDKLQAATPEERTALLDRLRHAEHRYKVQELFYKVAERTSRDTSISGRTQERDAMLAEWDKADPYQRIQMEHDADVFVAQTKPLSRGYHR